MPYVGPLAGMTNIVKLNAGEPGLNPRYDTIGVGYDATRRPDPYIAGRLAHHLAMGAESTYLDVACGSGNYTVALAGLGGRWHGVDQSKEMIRSAKPKSRGISWCQADAAALPFRDGVFDGAICTLAIHHFEALVPVFREICRVAGEGRLVIFTATPEQMRGYWLNDTSPLQWPGPWSRCRRGSWSKTL